MSSCAWGSKPAAVLPTRLISVQFLVPADSVRSWLDSSDPWACSSRSAAMSDAAFDAAVKA
jgi:hypothetical protein